MTRDGHRLISLLLSAAFHGGLLIGVTGRTPSLRPSPPPPRHEPVHVELVELADQGDHAFDFDVDKIGSRITRLFPFTEPLSLSSVHPPSRTGGNNGIVVMSLGLVSAPPVLRLSPAEMQSALDASWSRRDRWDAFQEILDLAQRFNPEQGDLSVLLRRYAQDNLLQPFHASQNPEARVWALVSVAADHSDFVRFITSFVERVPASKATTELLFLLDKLVQANLQAAYSLFTLDTLDGIEWTRRMSPTGADTLVAVKRHHDRILSHRRVWDESAIAYGYDEVRLGILQHLIRAAPDGYRANDARFLIGEIYWRQGRIADAQTAWGAITPDSTDDYFIVYSEVIANLAGDRKSRARIDIALNDQNRRWVHRSYQRLRHFGYRFDTF